MNPKLFIVLLVLLVVLIAVGIGMTATKDKKSGGSSQSAENDPDGFEDSLPGWLKDGVASVTLPFADPVPPDAVRVASGTANYDSSRGVLTVDAREGEVDLILEFEGNDDLGEFDVQVAEFLAAPPSIPPVIRYRYRANDADKSMEEIGFQPKGGATGFEPFKIPVQRAGGRLQLRVPQTASQVQLRLAK